jgi:hypothetical protein
MLSSSTRSLSVKMPNGVRPGASGTGFSAAPLGRFARAAKAPV